MEFRYCDVGGDVVRGEALLEHVQRCGHKECSRRNEVTCTGGKSVAYLSGSPMSGWDLSLEKRF